MEKVIEKAPRIIPKRAPQTVSTTGSRTTTRPDCPGVEFDANGKPVGYYTPVEVLDELDRKFVELYGEEGRRMVNAHREEWNRTGPWHFEMLYM